MTGQPWLAAALAVVMIATAGYCLTRLALSWRQGRGTDRQVDAMHVVMGVAMAGMLLPHVRLPLPGAWEAVFAAAIVMLAWRARTAVRHRAAGHRPAHDLQHVTACAAMLYMLAAGGAAIARPAGGMTATAGPSTAVALAFAVALLAGVVLATDRLTALPRVLALAGTGSFAGSGPFAGTAPFAAIAPPAGAGRPGGTGVASQGPPPLSPRLAVGCEIAMGLTMGYMLITML